MRELSLTVIKYGFNYEQMERTEKYAVYKQTFIKTGTVHGFEVFKIMISKDYVLSGSHVEGGECFPHNEAFGKWAWSCNTILRAKEIATEIENGKR
jgi:hypothetical protein